MTVQEIRSRLGRRTPGIMDARHHSAVLVPLVEQDGRLHLLYEQRAATLRRQPNEVCFPGGGVEPGESPLECALRETWEELSIPADRVEVIAPLDLPCYRGGYVLHPFLVLIDEDTAARICCNPAEVKEVFLVPVDELLSMTPFEYSYELVPRPGEDFPYDRIGIPRDYPWHRGTESGPVYHWRDKVIWGLTGRITRHLLRLLQP